MVISESFISNYRKCLRPLVPVVLLLFACNYVADIYPNFSEVPS